MLRVGIKVILYKFKLMRNQIEWCSHYRDLFFVMSYHKLLRFISCHDGGPDRRELAKETNCLIHDQFA